MPFYSHRSSDISPRSNTGPHPEILLRQACSGPNQNHKAPSPDCFDNNKELNNIDILFQIIHLKPHSIYELAKLLNKDLSNIIKILKFYEEKGVIDFKKDTYQGRKINTPKVKFDKIEFDLAA